MAFVGLGYVDLLSEIRLATLGFFLTSSEEEDDEADIN